MRVHPLVGALVLACAGAVVLSAAQQPARQVLRAGAYLIQVDAYPEKDGQPILGLTADDFELLEDGKPQVIDAARFLEFPQWTPDQQRRDPNTQRESHELAGDPAHRLFVIYLNRMTWQHGNYVEPALFEFLDRSMGPNDYVAVMTAMQSPSDLIFGQLTTAFKNEARRFLNVVDWMNPAYMLPEELEIFACFPGEAGEMMITMRRIDDVYRDLEGLISLLSGIRETRSTVIFVSEGLFVPAQRTITPLGRSSGRAPALIPPSHQMPPQRALGSFKVPGMDVTDRRCQGLFDATRESWSENRFADLLARARTANVALSPINPRGLVASPNLEMLRDADRTDDTFKTMASETGGLAIVHLNDMREGFRRIATSLTSHYVLTYYSTNQAQDGRIRRITVRLKNPRQTIRARREYRALLAADADVAAAEAAAAALRAKIPDGVPRALAELDADERTRDGTHRIPSHLRLFRAASPPAAPWQATTQRRFFRSERLRLEWSGDERPSMVRLLNRDGSPLAVLFDISRDDTQRTVMASTSLAALAPGLYIVEAQMRDETRTYLAIRVER